MWRPKVGVENHPLFILELSAVDQLQLEVRQSPSPLLWSTPGSEDTLMNELRRATVPAYKTGVGVGWGVDDSVNHFIRLLWGRSELKSEGPDCAQPMPGAHANCVAAGDSTIMVFIYCCVAKALQTVAEALEKPDPSGSQ